MRMRWVILIALAIVVLLMVVDYAHGQTVPATRIRFAPTTNATPPSGFFNFYIDQATGLLVCRNDVGGSCLPAGGGGGSGTVTSFSAGNLSPLFTSSVATATTTPALTFALSNAAANTVFGNNTGSTAAPAFVSITAAMVPTLNQSTTGNAATATALAADGTNCSAGNYPLGVDAAGNVQTCTSASGGGTVTSFSAGNLTPLFTTSVATATTTPALTFSLSTAAAHTFFGNNTGSTAAPAFSAITDADVPDTITASNYQLTSGKDVASGYAGLTASTKLNLAQGQEVWALADLSDVTAKSGTGTTVLGVTLTALATNDIITWNGSNWINATAVAKATALAANGTNCASTEAAIGVDASGNAEGCWTPGAGGGAVASSHYLTTVADANTNEVVVTPGEGTERRINETDSNGGPYTLDFDPNDSSYFWIREEFCGGIATSTGNIGDNGWALTNIVGTSVGSMQATAFPNLCSQRLASGATSGNGGVLSPTNLFSLGNLGGNTNWDVTFVFKLAATVTQSFRIGLAAQITAIEPTGGIWLRYDTNLADVAFKVETRSASTSTVGGTTYTVNTSFHKIRIRSTTAGTVIFTFDANSDQTISTNVPTVNLVPTVIMATRAASAAIVDVDFFAFKMRGITR